MPSAVRFSRQAVALISVFVLAAGLVLLQSFVLPRLVLRRMEQALKIKIAGRIEPEFFQTSFHLTGVQTAWDQKIRIFSGRLDVDYDAAALVTGKLALRLQGKKVASELLGDWALMAGQPASPSGDGQKVVFDDVFADFIMDAHGVREIKALRVESPSVHFRFGPSDPLPRERQA